MQDGRRFSEAADCFRQVIEGPNTVSPTPDNRDAATRLLDEIAGTKPNWARGQFSLGSTYEHTGDYGRARFYLAMALQLDRSLKAAVQSLFARMYWMEDKWTDAIAAADRALALNPSYYLAHVVRSKCCAALGRMDEACENNRRALEIEPHSIIHSDLLFEMNYVSSTTPETLHAEAVRWNSLYAAPLASRIRPHMNARDPDRRLNIGYVSPDLHRHPMMRFLPPVLEHHDRSRFE